MDCTCITYKDGKKEIKYWIDPMVDTRWVETYMYSAIPDEKVEEIKKVSTDKIQEILSKLF